MIAFHNQLHLVPENSQFFFVTLIAIAASLWIISASVYIRIPELPGATAGGGSAIKEAFASLMLLRNDAELRNFVIARSLMIAVAVAIPYIVLLIQRQSDGAFNNLGALLLAEGLAALISGHVWGKWSDTASHRVMGVAAALSALLFAIVILIQLSNSSLLGIGPIAGMVLFIAAACHQGIRIARKTYLVDIATSENRASYVAVSNTVIGILIAASGFFAIVDASYGTVATLGLLCLLSSIGAAMAFRLKPATA